MDSAAFGDRDADTADTPSLVASEFESTTWYSDVGATNSADQYVAAYNDSAATCRSTRQRRPWHDKSAGRESTTSNGSCWSGNGVTNPDSTCFRHRQSNQGHRGSDKCRYRNDTGW